MANPNFWKIFRKILDVVGAVGGATEAIEMLNGLKQNLQDLSQYERSELEDIIKAHNLKASLAGCTTEYQAFLEILKGLEEVDLEVRKKVISSVDRVLRLD